MSIDEQVIDLYLRGAMQKEIGLKFGRTDAWVRLILTKHNIKRRAPGGNRTGIPTDETRVLELLASTKSVRLTAQALGVGEWRVYAVKRRHNIVFPRKSSSLDETTVAECCQLRQRGWSWNRLAKKYGCRKSTLWCAVTGVTARWRHIAMSNMELAS